MSYRQITPDFTSPEGGVDTNSADEDQEACELFQICEQVIEKFREASRKESDQQVVRRGLERQITSMFGLDGIHAALLAELAFELMHLKAHGRFQTSEVEVGCLISRVTDGWVEPGSN